MTTPTKRHAADAFVRRIAALIDRSGKTQRQIALEVGYDKPNLIAMFKQGDTRVPSNKVPALALSLGADPTMLMRLWLATYEPELLAIVEKSLALLVTADERTWLEAARREFGGKVPAFDPTHSAIVHLAPRWI
ncbi:helix-turn-helix transcriptional regulator [Paracraurococcus ruber]|uniref:HTH cro/C1-type domain-containing protein n=1 Tax=Paracraurococcus ruber TaxID=77675 RepID=A0ABS1CUC0_9PROT|nr:helix-turn-helix transcriptional regulator [Paracraurococcus ruber]MBK1657801.1 hypothetical protein [Paracraurococcus ruber]